MINHFIIYQIISNKVVFVTGAGGSIGSELCKKIVSLGPKLIILLENNEANLYKITNEILKNDKVSVKTFLGSVGNKLLLEKIFYRYKVDIVFHAAAYKHVPIVQDNPIEGIRNNVLNTKLLCEVVFEFKIKNIILISTDKAVRPTNIMGATKRVAELIFQSFSEESFLYSQENPNNNYSKFSMVRFGNVLGSSGSVVPLFQSQIDEGGPITLTDPNVVRYFMTIPEAAQLVIQAAAMSEGGELFLLDMGNPIKIKYLAEQMIRLNGLKLKSNKYPDGDIAIQISGLRPGEKLYEELLIDGASEETLHPGIFKSRESFLKKDILWKKLNQLSSLIDKLNEKESLEIIAELVPEWEYERNKIN
ncbi:polysaccharide biosynthesis protein [Prochlorococcus sp. AH-716-K03]|nr:polysaccharide biosynthesis protein [Prochlorococcus sp. AH-716-K03]